jgi:hypothetical protein
MHASRIRALYVQAADATKQHGLHWYATEHAYAAALARHAGEPLAVVCACLAVLSPRCQWPRVKDACAHLLAGERPSGVFGHNLVKAKAILGVRHGDLIDPARAPKTWAFWQNLWHPLDRNPVTLDTWMCRAHDLSPRVSLSTYQSLAAAYRAMAEELDLIPNQLQATVWLHMRRQQSRRTNERRL